MKIDEKLKNIKEYILSIRYVKGVPVVDVMFKEAWKIPSSKIVGAQPYKDKPGVYMFYPETTDILVDDVLEYIEEVVNINIEREAKLQLLKAKIVELKDFFSRHKLVELSKLEFVIEDDLDSETFDESDLDETPFEEEVLDASPKEDSNDEAIEEEDD